MTSNTHIPREHQDNTPRALILAIHTPEQTQEDVERSCAELDLLAKTLGIRVLGRKVQKRASGAAAWLMGKGKLREIARLTGGPGLDDEQVDDFVDDDLPDDDAESGELLPGEVDLILVDAELSPRQQRNLERVLGVEVLDRSAVILQIFERRAQTRESRLEVEIARLRYEMPRLSETVGADDRHGGGGGGGAGFGGRGGRGHSNLELARQRSRDRIAELKRELADVQATESARRDQRQDTFQTVLIGYTNAGKSTLMRALTGSDVLVEDKLFATLGTTVRRLSPETTPQILVSDTVGFITNLPHELVASFRSTLDEARYGQFLLLVVDVSDSQWREQLRVTRQTLKSIGAADISAKVVLNKVDRLSAEDRRFLEAEMPEAIQLSAHSEDDVRRLREIIIAAQNDAMREETLLIPFKMGQMLGEIHENARILDEKYTAEGTTLRLLARPESIDRWRTMLH